MPQARHAVSPDLLARFDRHGRREERHHRQGEAGPYLVEFRDAMDRPHAGGAAAGLDRGGRRRSSRSPTRPRPRSCRRAATPAWSAGRSRTTARSCCRSTAWTRSARSMRSPTPSPARPASPCSARARPPPTSTGSIRNCCRRKEAAPSAAISRPMPAAPRRSPTASRARTRSASRWCWPTAASCNNLNKLKKDNTGYDLREPVHRRRRHARHHHRGGAAAGAAAALGRDRVAGDPLGAGRGRSARPRHRAHRAAASPASRSWRARASTSCSSIGRRARSARQPHRPSPC